MPIFGQAKILKHDYKMKHNILSETVYRGRYYLHNCFHGVNE